MKKKEYLMKELERLRKQQGEVTLPPPRSSWRRAAD